MFYFLFYLLLSGNKNSCKHAKERNRSVCIQSSSFLLLFLLSTIRKRKAKDGSERPLFTVHPRKIFTSIPLLHKSPIATKHPSRRIPLITHKNQNASIMCSPIFSLLLEILKATTTTTTTTTTTKLRLVLLFHLTPTRPLARPQSASLPRQQTRPAEPQR